MKKQQPVFGKTAPPSNQVFYDHLIELRRRLFIVGLIFIVGGIVGYLLRKQAIALLVGPLNEQIYYTSPAGGFSFIMKICTMFGLALAMPATVYNLINFVQPALKKVFTLGQVRLLSLVSFGLAVGGGLFAFLVVLPASLHFFGTFQSNGVEALISANDYLTFVTNAIMTFAILFQLPLLMLAFNRMTPLPPKKLMGYQKYVVVGAMSIGVVLPFSYDPLMQFLIALPIVTLYNVGVGGIWLMNRRKHKRVQHLPSVLARPATGPVQQAFDDLVHDASVFLQPALVPVPVTVPEEVPPLSSRYSAQRTAVRRTDFDFRPCLIRPAEQPQRRFVQPARTNFTDLRSV